MARIKSDKQALINIIDWPAADQLVRELGDIQINITAAEHKAANDINETKLELEGKVNQLQGRQSYIVKSLEMFALAHTKDFGEARSRKLDFGTLGWRLSSSIKIAGTTLERIKQFFTPAKQKTCLRIKESVDKEALAKLTDEELARVAARRKTKDAFFVEPNSQKAVDCTE
jgi:phage host-nuclease inhibitor protein Gam